MTRIRKAVAGLVLVAMMAAPMSALAVEGDTSENLNVTVAATLSATFPAAQTYTVRTTAPFDYTWIANITAVNANNPTGITIDVTADDFTGTATLPTSVRKMETSGGTGGLVKGIDVMPGGFATPASVHTVASSSGVVIDGTVGVRFTVPATLLATLPAGAHTLTSAVHWTAATN